MPEPERPASALVAPLRLPQARCAASFADASQRSTDNTTCSLRSGLRSDGLAIIISLHQTQPRPEQEILTRDTDDARYPCRLDTRRAYGGLIWVRHAACGKVIHL